MENKTYKPIVKKHVAFWVPVYRYSLDFFAQLTGMEIDAKKYRKVIAKGIRWERIDNKPKKHSIVDYVKEIVKKAIKKAGQFGPLGR